jgi:hypothetical protein
MRQNETAQLLQLGLEIGASISEIQQSNSWELENDIQRTIVPIIVHGVSVAVYGYVAYQDGETEAASVLTRTALECAGYAYWIATTSNALGKFNEGESFNIQKYLEHLNSKFPDEARNSITSTQDYKEALGESGKPLKFDDVSAAHNLSKLLFMSWKRMSQFVHPSITLVNNYYVPDGESIEQRERSDREAVLNSLCLAMLICLESAIETQPRFEKYVELYTGGLAKLMEVNR